MSKNYEVINEHIKEFLKFNGYQSTLECMQAEEKTKRVINKDKKVVRPPVATHYGERNIPKMYRLFDGSDTKESKFETDLKKLENKHVHVLQSAR